MAAPWDQLPDESGESYARFLLYRNLGPKRSKRTAYYLFLKKHDGYRGGVKGLHVPGHWSDDSRRFRWTERAGAWDCRNLSKFGARVFVLHARAMEKVAAENLRAAGRHKPGDAEWADLMASLKVVATFLTPELVKGVQDRARSPDGTPPPHAAPGGKPSVK